MLGLARDLFGTEVRPWSTPVWDNQVSAWSAFSEGKLIGHFYLDMHPRDGKYSHAAMFPIRSGIEGRQLPLAALVCNFPATGSMDHEDVTTFLHEFGHLLHFIYSGHGRYAAETMSNLPTDFVEAPSQFLEEWTWDYDTLKKFASDPMGRPIPQSLVRRMNVGRHFGDAGNWKIQIMLAEVSLAFHDRPPSFDLSKLYDALWGQYAFYPPLVGDHGYDSFTHLNGYSAIYYTYIWDEAIALDLFSRFKLAGLHNARIAKAYRLGVLKPGASEDPNTLVKRFLGRPISTKAFEAELRSH